MTGKQVRLKFVHINAWTVAKICLIIGVGLGVVGTLGTLVLWLVMNQSGAFDRLHALLTGISSGSKTASSAKTFLGLGPVMGLSITLSLVSALAGSAIGAIFAILYNFSVKLTGGLFIGFINR